MNRNKFHPTSFSQDEYLALYEELYLDFEDAEKNLVRCLAEHKKQEREKLASTNPEAADEEVDEDDDDDGDEDIRIIVDDFDSSGDDSSEDDRRQETIVQDSLSPPEAAAMVITAHSELLQLVQFAKDHKTNSARTSSCDLTELMNQMHVEMDHRSSDLLDAFQSEQTGAPQNAPSHSNDSASPDQNHGDDTENEYFVDVDDFFAEYPEFVRSRSDQSSSSSSSESSTTTSSSSSLPSRDNTRAQEHFSRKKHHRRRSTKKKKKRKTKTSHKRPDGTQQDNHPTITQPEKRDSESNRNKSQHNPGAARGTRLDVPDTSMEVHKTNLTTAVPPDLVFVPTTPESTATGSITMSVVGHNGSNDPHAVAHAVAPFVSSSNHHHAPPRKTIPQSQPPPPLQRSFSNPQHAQAPPPPPPAPPVRNPYAAAKRYPPPTAPGPAVTQSNPPGPSAWDDLHNSLNPFQTAFEVDAAAHGSKNKKTEHANPYQRYPQHQQHQIQQYPTPPAFHHHNNAQRVMVPPQQPPPHDEASAAPENFVIRDSLKRKFQPPKRVQPCAEVTNSNPPAGNKQGGKKPSAVVNKATSQQKQKQSDENNDEDDDLPEELKRFGKDLVEKIESEIMYGGDPTTFEDIAGLDDAKQTIQEVICWPMKRPDLFTGLRRGPNALLLYGPPGTGKTLIGKAIAHESGATFFSISSSSLTSKWIGEGEKLVRTMFAVAAYREPAVVFIDEIDSLLTQRKSDENEASRRIKTEFLVQMDGTGTSGQGRVLTIGCTNRPQELDEAARRRFVKRLYIPLPNQADRLRLLQVMLRKNTHSLTDQEMEKLAKKTERFSGADLKALCEDAAMGPLRSLPSDQNLENVNAQDLPAISFKDFRSSLRGMKPSVSPDDLVQYEEWDKVYGSKRADALDEEEDEDEDD